MAGLNQCSEMRQLITEFYARFMQVVLESRFLMPIPSSGERAASGSVCRPQRRAFNLVFGVPNLTIDKMAHCTEGVWEALTVDILYLHKSIRAANEKRDVRKLAAQGSLKIALDSPVSETEILLERWTVEFVQCSAASQSEPIKGRGSILDKGKERLRTFKVGADQGAASIFVEENLSILLRSLYSTTRLLPTHRLSRILSSKGKHKSRLSYRIYAKPPPLLERNKKDMTHFPFPSADCYCGQVCISLTYRQSVPVVEQGKSPFPPRVIDDYLDKYQLKQQPEKKIEHVQSLPPTWCLSSFKASNPQLQRPSKSKEMALKEEQSPPILQTPGSLWDNIECPFAIIDRKEPAKLSSVKSDVGVYGGQAQQDNSLGSFLDLLGHPSPLRRTTENLILSQGSRQTVADALEELKLYIHFKDNLQRKCT